MRWAMAISDLVRDKESVRIFAVQTKKAWAQILHFRFAARTTRAHERG